MVRYLSDIWFGFISILSSMAITLRYLFTPAITVQYPEEKREMPLRAMNKHYLTVDLDTGKLKCTACDLCAVICPTKCIHIVGEGKGKVRHAVEFDIDHNLCMYCNLCVEVCPFDAITMWTGNYEFGGFSRTDLFIDIEELRAPGFVPTPMTPRLPAAKAGKAAGPAKRP